MALTLGLFARLKLRFLANSLRGKGWRIAGFVMGCVAGGWFAVVGGIVFALTGVDRGPAFTLLIPAFGGATVVLGWLFIPLVWAGVDETLDPARFALLPLPRRTLIGGLLVAALLGVPALATLVATAGLVVGAAARGGVVAAVVQLGGSGLALVLCVALSRSLTSAFASLLRARRTRDLAAVVLALLAALLGPLQIGIVTALQSTGVDRLVRPAQVLGWTPLAAPYLVGMDVAEGRWLAAAGRLVLTAVAVVLLLWWWSRTLPSAMLGAASGSGPVRSGRVAGGPTAQLYPRIIGWLPRTAYGALIAREARYWWRDARRRANLITLTAIGVFLPVLGTLGATSFGSAGTRSPGPPTFAIALVGSLAAVMLANQFGFDGSAYASHVIVGVPGRLELRARAVGYSLYVVPILVVIAVIVGVLSRHPGQLAVTLGALLAVYGTGLAVNVIVSVLAAYSLPETSNPFAVKTGTGMTKSLFALVAMVGAVLAALPVLIGAALLTGAWSWVMLPIGAAYGAVLAALGIEIAADRLDRRAPELLAAVSPER